MGCASSVQTKKKEFNEAENVNKNTSIHQNKRDLTENCSTPTKEENVENGSSVRNHQSNGFVATEKELTVNLVSDVSANQHEEPSSDADALNETGDIFDSTLKPDFHMKDHPTQETLDFVYKNSLTNPESNSGNIFSPSSNGTGSLSGLSTNRYIDRRPSGIPPPARALKPGDFLYQKTINLPGAPDFSKIDTRNVIIEA